MAVSIPAGAVLSQNDFATVDGMLHRTDALLDREYPGDDGRRQPVHTVYVSADKFVPGFFANWGTRAIDVVREHGGLEVLCSELGVPSELVEEVAARVADKLATEPIEDLRLDFEDGYGDRGDDTEDADAAAAATAVAAVVADGTSPPFIGIRFKCFESATRARGIRTLDIFVSTLVALGRLPDGLVLTLPKVSTVSQVEAMVYVCARLESVLGLEAGRLSFEVQMETPQLILATDGRVPVAQLLHRADGRVSALHYGTYDYSASLGISAEYQSMEHPAADYAKQVMQVAVAGTGVRLSDGSSNIIPIGDPDSVLTAWKIHARLIRRSLENGFYQGWDLHATQLPSRYIATYSFYQEGYPAAAIRLNNYVNQIASSTMDEPATARALAGFVSRGLSCGALTDWKIQSDTGLTVAELIALACPPKNKN